MFPTFERQYIDPQAIDEAHREAMKALKRAKKNGATGPEAALIAEKEKNRTYKKLTGIDLPGFKTEATMKPLSNYDAVGLAEGFVEGTDDQRIQAWQQLIDTGLAWHSRASLGGQQ